MVETIQQLGGLLDDALMQALVWLVFLIPAAIAVALFVWLMAWIWMRIRRTLHPTAPEIPLDYSGAKDR